MDFKTTTKQLRAHARMLANLDGSFVYWMHFAHIYGELPGRPVMLLAQARTCAILSARMEKNKLHVAYREAGIYLAPDSDEMLTEYKNPITGKRAKVEGSFREGPADYTRTATKNEIIGNSEMDIKGTRSMGWTWHSSGSRVWMINQDSGIFAPANPTSENLQAREPLGGQILQTWHADRRDLDNPKLTGVPTAKSYVVTLSAWPSWIGDPGERGGSFIRGMGAKLNAEQAAKSPDFIRLNRVHGDFFAAARRA